jgi:DNA polymerase-3 subunit beta
VALAEGFLIVETEKAKIAVRLIDGEFPNYDQVIPKTKGKIAVIDSAVLAQALRRVMLMATDKTKCVRLEFASNKLKISSSSPELGEAVEELEIKYKDEALTVGFNAQYLLDISNACPHGDKLLVELNGELGPGKFCPEKDESSVGIVMPMRLEPIYAVVNE